MKRALIACASVCAVMFMAGCDWESVDSETEAWNDEYNFANFNGVFRAVSGGAVVTEFEATPGTDPSDQVVTGERIGTSVAGGTFYSGVLRRRPVVAGSLTITAGGFGFIDDGFGALTASGGRTGTINYDTGAWTIDLIVDIAAGVALTASYLYTEGGTDGHVDPGNSGEAIYSFLVQQEGNLLHFLDSNGNTYDGHIGSMRTTGGNGTNLLSGIVVAQFQVQGTSFGKNVTIAGIFQGSLNESIPNVMFDRQMQATWVEAGGRVADIIAGAPNIMVFMPEPLFDTTTAPTTTP